MRDCQYKQFKKTKSPEDFEAYKKLRNKALNTIKVAKQNYYKNKINEESSQPKKLWATLKELGSSKKLKTKDRTHC